jgi:hypothetical protein
VVVTISSVDVPKRRWIPVMEPNNDRGDGSTDTMASLEQRARRRGAPGR